MFLENKVWTKEELWELRRQIVLGSVFVRDYRNSFGVPEDMCCAFFDGYLSFLQDEGENGNEAEENDESLFEWFCCFVVDDCPLPVEVDEEESD